MQANLKLLDIARDRRETLTKEKEKRNVRKRQTTTTNTFLLLYRKIYILLEGHLKKFSFYCYICISFFTSQVIGNAVTKYQHPYRHALVL